MSNYKIHTISAYKSILLDKTIIFSVYDELVDFHIDLIEKLNTGELIWNIETREKVFSSSMIFQNHNLNGNQLQRVMKDCPQIN